MRLLQLPTGRDELLDLHPNMTVVQGLDDGSHRRLVEAVAGLARGESPMEGGLLEAHGVLFELRADLLALLEIDPQGPDPVVHAGDLPTQPLNVDARELRTREQEFGQLLARIAEQAEQLSQARTAVAAARAALEDARRARADAEAGAARRIDEVDAATRRLDQVAERRRRIDEQLADLQPEKAAAEAARREVEDRTAGVRDAVRVAAARRAELAAELDAVMRDRDPEAAAALERAQADLQALMATQPDAGAAVAAHPAPIDDSPPEVVPVGERLEWVEARLAELDRLLVAVAAVDPAGVAEALALLEGGDPVEKVPSDEAIWLADELETIQVQLGEDVDDPFAERSLTEARERLDDARQALLEATQAVRNPELDREEVGRLEDAHEALLDAIDRADGRFAGNRARERVVALRAAEQEVLDRLGFASYSDYMMGNSLAQDDPEKTAALAAAREALAAAEEEWSRFERATDEALARAAVLDHRRGLIERSRALLGTAVPVKELPGALRDLRVPAISAEVSAQRLQAALVRAGLELGDEQLDPVELRMIADAWISEVSDAEVRRRTIHEERAALEEEQRGLLTEPAALEPLAPHEPATPTPEEDWELRLGAARERVAQAEDRWLAHELAEDRLAGVRSDLDAATATEAAAADAAAGAEAEVAAKVAAVTSVTERERALEEMAAREATAEAEATAALAALAEVPEPAVLDEAVEAAQVALRNAEDAVDAESRALSLLDADGQAAAVEIERLQDIVAAQDSGTATEAEELEWYLLARLAAQRAVSVAGSLPLLLDDALRGLDAAGIDHLLGRLERMAEAVQVIVISEDPLVAAWATDAGPARAAVVRPGAP